MSDDRRIDVRTLIIASVASAVAALVTSQFWTRGTPVAAALTPVIVTIVSELLHRPTDKIAERFTAETDALPEAAGAEPPPRSEEIAPRTAPDDSVRVYRSRPRLNWRLTIVTAAAAFVLGVAILTLPELVGGDSIAGGGHRTTIFGGKHKAKSTQPVTTPVTQPAQTAPTQTQTVTETVPRTTPTQTTKTTPQTTTRQPAAPAPGATAPTTTTKP